MKRRDLILIALPITLLVAVLAVVILLVAQYRGFKASYIADAKDDLRLRTELIAETLVPDIRQGNLERITANCARFRLHPTRVSVIREDGTVLADSNANVATLGNHSDRPELAEVGEDDGDGFVVRYSVTTASWLLIHAVKIGDCYVRVSMPMNAITHTVSLVRRSVTLAILLGAALVLFLTFYVIFRVRPHFIALQTAATSIAKGRLDTPIEIPAGGILRELAQAVSIMARQLRHRIADLQRERNEFDALFNALREPLLVVSQSGEVLRRNRAAGLLFTVDDAHETFRVERTACPDLIKYVHEAFESPTVGSREIAFETAAQTRTLLAHAVRMEREGEICLLLLLTDLTEIRRLEGFRSDFIANVSHEIRTPLTAILSTVETLRENHLTEAQYARCLDILGRHSKRLGDLVQDILSLAAIERRQTGPAGEDFVPCRLDAVLRDAVGLCVDAAERANVKLEVPETLPEVTVNGDPRLIEQCVVNLVTNAIRHAGTPDVVLGLGVREGKASITVTDHGCGIAAEHLPRLFERFYRVHKERSRATGGTGLGLAIVKHVAILHGGTIDVASEPGQGTTFTLTVPAC